MSFKDYQTRNYFDWYESAEDESNEFEYYEEDYYEDLRAEREVE